MLRIIVCAALFFLLAGCANSSNGDLSRDGPADPHSTESPTAVTNPLSLVAPTTAPAVGKLYTCPMHASVIMDHPGKCPICGMTLEPKVGAK